ncbi:MAG: carotenoid biosynthesis protein [Chloracidobacterium sp.]|nr:carotenoid biosynthesis protein [Chloracidobacterium sp.]
MANVVIPPEARFVSGVNVILFAIPVFWATMMWLGRRDAVLLFGILGVLALAIETSAMITGFPYGHFGYSELLGYRLFGLTPWTVFLAWTPLVLAAYAISVRGERLRSVSCAHSDHFVPIISSFLIWC